MPIIDIENFPKIVQVDAQNGCIPASIENVLKYYGENNYCELKILKFAQRTYLDEG